MKARMIGIVAAGLALTLVGCGSAEKMAQDKGHVPLTQAELEQMHAQTRTVSWTNPAGRSGTATYEPDGTASVTWAGGTDTGQWRISDGRFCSQWKTLRNGAENCTRTYKVGDNEYRAYNPDGTLNATFSHMN